MLALEPVRSSSALGVQSGDVGKKKSGKKMRLKELDSKIHGDNHLDE